MIEQSNNDKGGSKNTDSQINGKEYTPPEMEGEISVSAMSEAEFMTIAASSLWRSIPG